MPANRTPPHETRDYDSKDKKFEISRRCLDKESEDKQTILALKTWVKPCENVSVSYILEPVPTLKISNFQTVQATRLTTKFSDFS